MINNSIQELFKDDKDCREEMIRIRKMFGFKDTCNIKNMQAATKTLSFMYLYCDERLQTPVLALMKEVELRSVYLL